MNACGMSSRVQTNTSSILKIIILSCMLYKVDGESFNMRDKKTEIFKQQNK